MTEKRYESLITRAYNEKRPFKSIEEYLKNNNSYIIPHMDIDLLNTEKVSEIQFHVCLMIKDEEIEKELVDRTHISEEELHQEGAYIITEADFFTTGDLKCIDVCVVDDNKKLIVAEPARLSYAENVAFHNKVMEIVPESIPFVSRSLEFLLEKIEQGKREERASEISR